MNIVIPMAGFGTRFKQEGFKEPKPLIKVDGKTLIRHSIESFGIEGQYIFITRKYNDEQDNITLTNELKALKPDCIEIQIDEPTSGAAETCLFAESLIDNDRPLIVTNCDQRLEWDAASFINFCNEPNTDGVIVVHDSNNPKHSYALLGDDGAIKSLHEKDPVSNHALVGIHYWRYGKDFIESAKKLVTDFAENKRPECYISETYNYLIQQGKKINVHEVGENDYIALGTPYDLNIYKGKVREFFTDKPKTIFCDIDGTILNHIHQFSELNKNSQVPLQGVLKKFNEWDSQGHKIVLVTARKESGRKMTEQHLQSLGFCWDQLIMGVTSGERILINDKINAKSAHRAKSVNLLTNEGFNNCDWEGVGL